MRNNMLLNELDKDLKNFEKIKISIKEDEKVLYRMMKELETIGETVLDFKEHPDSAVATKRLSHRGKELFEKGFLDPIWRTNQYTDENKRLIRKKENVDIIEIPGNSDIFFEFKRRKIK